MKFSNHPSDRVVLCEFLETGIDGVASLSPFCTKVRMGLELAKVPFTSRRVSRPDAFKHLNPAAQLPVLLVGEAAIADSTAILTRIELMAPGAFDRGLDASTRAESWLWEEMADTVLNGFLVAARWHDDANWPAVSHALFHTAPWPVQKMVVPMLRKRVHKALKARGVTCHGPEALQKRFDETLDRLEARAPVTGYWLGDGVSRADLAISAQLGGLRTSLTPAQCTKVNQRTRLAAYVDRVVAATAASSATAPS